MIRAQHSAQCSVFAAEFDMIVKHVCSDVYA